MLQKTKTNHKYVINDILLSRIDSLRPVAEPSLVSTVGHLNLEFKLLV